MTRATINNYLNLRPAGHLCSRCGKPTPTRPDIDLAASLCSTCTHTLAAGRLAKGTIPPPRPAKTTQTPKHRHHPR